MRLLRALSSGAVLATAIVASPGVARADDFTPVSATGKGIAGGALLGGETVMLVEAAFGAKPAWAYIVGGLAGAAGGGVGGYFVEQGATAKPSLYLLAGGMALIIPTTVAVLSASAYEPPKSYTEDKPPADEPVAEPPNGSPPPGAGATPAASSAPAEGSPGPSSRLERHRARHLPPAIVDVAGGTVALSVPAVEVGGVYTRVELATFGVAQTTEVRVPVVHVLF